MLWRSFARRRTKSVAEIPLSYFAALSVKVSSGPVFDKLRHQGNHARGGSADLGH
jgi:hypothetical protein